jgi:subtilisin-like proprotein convertase family protein
MKQTLLTIVAALSFATGFAQQPWQVAHKAAIPAATLSARDSRPKTFGLYKLDINSLKAQLQQAPLRQSGQTSAVIITLPNADGHMQHFRVYNAPVLSAGLAAKYPNIQTYVGQCVEDPATVIRFSTTLYGLHVMALANAETWYIDPYTKTGDYYIVYKKSSLQTAKTFHCSTDDKELRRLSAREVAQTLAAPMDNGNWRTYRTAILATVEYSAFHIAEAGLEGASIDEQKEAVISAIAATITRVNSMFERDLSVSLQLIDREDEVVFIDSDEVNNEDAGDLLNEGNAVIYATIGEDNFDFGHSFGTSGGGLAAGAPCSDFKAGAMTGMGSPVGDPFDIDYVAHEMGHQFGAPHTFNAECGGNRAGDDAYEPGGGTTIMAYAGVCDPVIQWHSDAQFHATSIAHMRSRINGESNCVTLIPTGNIPPVANAGGNYVIPKGTAFILEGSATDANGDALTYDWEQMNTEISVQPPVADAEGGPNFRSQPISTSPNRWMPRIEDVLANNLAPQWEVIPTVGRTLDFALTVRDNNINGGESHTDTMHIDVAGTAGPFQVTLPNTAVTWEAATNRLVTWNVAGTTANGVNTPFVDIYLSTDGGYTYPITVATAIPNDGTESILVPNVATTQARLMVRGHGNIFYDISNTNFTITAAQNTYLATVTGEQTQQICKGNNASFTLDVSYLNNFSGTVNFTAVGTPAGALVTFSPASLSSAGQVLVTVSNTANAAVGDYNIVAQMVSGTDTKNVTLHLKLLSTDFALLQPVAPEDGANTQPLTLNLDWTDDVIASAYHIQVASDAAFANIISETSTTESSYTVSGLTEGTQYYWRVKGANAGCEGSYGTTATFYTGEAFCNEYTSAEVPADISWGDPSTFEVGIDVEDNFPLNDIQVSLDIDHTWISDLEVTLISPAGTEVTLFSQVCGDNNDAFVTFYDGGEALTCHVVPALSGVVAPATPLSALRGEDTQGTWILRVADVAGGDGGSLNSVNLFLCGLNPALSTGNPAKLNDFVLYPNPNNGNFSLQFMATGGTATIIVYDIRGRMVHQQQNTTAAGLTTLPVQLQAEQGVYMVTAEQNGLRTTRKIVIK